MSVIIDFFKQVDSDVDQETYSFDQVTVPPSESGTVADIKEHIMETQHLDKLLSDMVVRKKGNYLSLKDTDVVKAEEHLEACLFEDEDGDEAASVKIWSNKAVYILTGTNWNFQTIPIENEHLEEEIPFLIKTSKHNKSMQPVEHKFAIFDKKPDDDNYWRAERYTLEKKYENHTIKITHSWWRGEKQRTVQVEEGPTLQLDGEMKTFSRKKEASRKEVLTSLVTAGAALLGVPVAVVVVASAPVVAPAAAATAGIAATVAVANAGLKTLLNKDSLK